MKIPRSVFYFFLWVVVLLSGYYFFHQPVALEQALALLTALYNTLAALLVLAACAGLAGKLLQNRLPPGLAGFSVQAAAGAGAFGLIWLGLGVLGLFRWWIAAIVLVVTLVWCRREIVSWLKNLILWRTIWQDIGRIERTALVLTAILAICQLWIALAPPVKYDALTYHLALPRLYLESGRLIFMPDNPYWGHPQIVEMLYTWTAALGTPMTAAVFSWWAGVTMLCGIAGFVREFDPQSSPEKASAAAALAVAFLMAGATLRWMFGWAYSDLFSAWFGTAVIYMVFLWHRTGETRWFLWAGVFSGFAVSTKYTAGVIALAAFLLIWLVREIRRVPLRTWALGALLAVLVFAPWAMKNVRYTGNPIFPYLLPTSWYSADRLAIANLPPADYQLLPQFILPLYITWAGIDSASGPSTDLGPLLVLFALPALICYRREPLTRFLGLSLSLGWLAISLAGARFGHLQQPRLYFAILPALAILAGWGWPQVAALKAGRAHMRLPVGLIVLAVLTLALWQDLSRTIAARAVPTSLGILSHEAYLEENTGAYIVAMHNLEALPAAGKVLMLWEARGLYAPTNVTADAWIDAWRDAYRSTGDPQVILDSWRNAGYSHLLLNQPGMEFMRAEDKGISADGWRALDGMLASLPPPKEIGGPYYLLYEISDPP